MIFVVVDAVVFNFLVNVKLVLFLLLIVIAKDPDTYSKTVIT